MAKTIWKFDLTGAFTDFGFTGVDVEIPKEAQILTVQEQFGKPCLWAIVDPKAEKEKRAFRIIGTGWGKIEGFNGLNYIATFQQANGSLIWHVFEVIS